MRKFDAWGLAKLLQSIDAAEHQAELFCLQERRDEVIPQDFISLFIDPLILLAVHFAQALRLESTHNRVWENGPFTMAVKCGNLTFQEVRNELKVLRESIQADLEKRHFVFILPDRAALLTGMHETFAPIWLEIPDSYSDTTEAINCYALERNTAAVYHLMRVAEYGLRRLARKLRVSLTHKGKACPVEFGDWEKVITAIKGKIDEARTLPAGPHKQRKLELYSDAADHCVFMKDIWRNNVAHARRPYKSSEALGVIERVRDFMHFLALTLLRTQTKS